MSIALFGAREGHLVWNALYVQYYCSHAYNPEPIPMTAQVISARDSYNSWKKGKNSSGLLLDMPSEISPDLGTIWELGDRAVVRSRLEPARQIDALPISNTAPASGLPVLCLTFLGTGWSQRGHSSPVPLYLQKSQQSHSWTTTFTVWGHELAPQIFIFYTMQLHNIHNFNSDFPVGICQITYEIII